MENKKLIISQAKSLISNENNIYANLSNLSSFFKEYLPDTNWVGFYIVDDVNKNLVLGPFQGKVACVRIPFNKGVCGKCYTNKKTIYVNNVHEFQDHIACDSNTNSELVIPIIKNNSVVVLLDIDSTKYNRFNEKEISFWNDVVTEIFEDFHFQQ
ncbi:GAF domain-containing protein [Gemelliphila asaccharolytica]|uniref:GAF domain protein n=1 Tax=Gemelliphila asaccharolytica TaxID=502393 RepID=A0ABR5TMG9_9BACL|nr:GAF domain-containing protein [Gemella asaccharolytica]KXB58524.1 GAF domain protein [Gemella asaccharolytica]